MQRRRENAERDARDAEDRANAVRTENERARREFEANMENDPTIRAEKKRLGELQDVLSSNTVTEEEKARAAEERDTILRRQRRRWEDSPAGREAQARADAADAANAADRAVQREQDAMLESAMRGRELGETQAERAAKEMRFGLADIGAAMNLGFLDQNVANRRASQFVNDQMRASAPAIFSLADSVENALLQGPSRAALNATDVSTVEGQRELNRLLRGDDSARDQNIVELEKQSQLLQGIKTAAEKTAEQMGIVLNWN